MISDVHMNAMEAGTNPLVRGGNDASDATAIHDRLSIQTPSLASGGGGTLGVNPMFTTQRNSMHTQGSILSPVTSNAGAEEECSSSNADITRMRNDYERMMVAQIAFQQVL